MKNYILILFSLVLFSCGGDDNGLDNVLGYDGDNATSPLFPAGSHEAAARFPSFETNKFPNKVLSSVEIYVYNVPSTFTIRIYRSGSAAGPDQLVLEEEVSSQLAANSYNAYTLNSPISINGEIWISASWTQNDTQQVIGCDAGPANPNGDWIFLSTDGQDWTSFRDRTGESVNWNIRGVLTDI